MLQDKLNKSTKQVSEQNDEIIKLLNEQTIVLIYLTSELRRIQDKLEIERTNDPKGVVIKYENE
jgi:hypothetical protein